MASTVGHVDTTGRGDAGSDRDRQAALEDAIEAYLDARAHADLVVLVGDLADDGSARAYYSLKALLADLNAPVVAVAGNHDDPRLLRKLFPDDEITINGWRILAVDTAAAGRSSGLVDVRGVTRRLDDEPHRPTALVMHHPPTSPSTGAAFQLDGSDRLVEALHRRGNVKLIASGHLHMGFQVPLEGLVVAGGPSTLIGFRHSPDGTFERDHRLRGVGDISLFSDGTFDVGTILTEVCPPVDPMNRFVS